MWNFLFYEKRQIKFYVRIRVPYEMLKNFLKYFKLVKKDEKSIPNVVSYLGFTRFCENKKVLWFIILDIS